MQHLLCVCVCDYIKSIKSAEARYEIFVISLAAKITEPREGRGDANPTPCVAAIKFKACWQLLIEKVSHFAWHCTCAQCAPFE